MQIFFSKIKFKSFINATIRKNLKWSVTLLFAIIFANQQIKIAQGLSVDIQLLSCPGLIQVSVTGGTPVGNPNYVYEWRVKNADGEYEIYVDDQGYQYSGVDDLATNQVNERKIEGAAPGFYEIIITDQDGNRYQQSDLELTPPVDLDARIDFQGLICSDEPDSGLVLLEFINGFADYNWVLSQGASEILNGIVSGSNYLVIEGLSVGEYTLGWTDANRCTGTKTISIESPNPINLDLIVIQNVSCPGGNDGEVSLNFSGGWIEIFQGDTDPRKYMFELYRDGGLVQQWSNSEATNNIVNLQAGNYQILYSDRINENNTRRPFSQYNFDSNSYSCTKSQSFTITEPDPYELNLTSTVAVCQGDTNGEIAITPSGGTPNYAINFYTGHFDDADNPVVDNNDMTLLVDSPVTNVSAGQEVKKTGLGAGNYAVLLEDANGCLKAENLMIIENPLGQVDAINDITACSGDVITQAFTTSEVTGTTRYEWTNDNTAVGLAASGSSDISFTGTNTTSAPITATITVTPFYSNYGIECEGPSETFVIRINPEPVGTFSNISVCSNENFDINLQNNIDDTANGGNGVSSSFSWVVTNINGTISGVALNDASTGNITGTVSNTSNTLAVIEYTVIPTANTTGCAGDEFTVTVTVDPEPVGVTTTEDVCSDVAFSFDPQDNIDDTGNGGNDVVSTFAWAVTAITGSVTGATIGDSDTGNVTGTLTNTSSTIGTVEYTITPTSAPEGCEGTPFTITVTVNPEPVVSDQTVGPVCSDQPLGANFNSSSTVAAATYNITNLELNGLTVSAGNAGGITNGLTAADLADDAFTNITNAPVNVVYTLVPLTAGGCEGQVFTVTVTIDPEPVVDPQTTTVCSDELVGLTLADDVDGPSVATYNLIGITDNGLTAGLGNQVIGNGLLSDAIVNDTWENLTSAALDVVYTFVPIGNNGCAGDEFTVTVRVESEPVVADQSLTVCSEETSGIDFNSSSTVSAATYNITNLELNGLTVSAGNAAVSNGLTAADLADDAFTNTTNGAIDVVYTVVPITAGGCQGDAFTITVTVNPEPVIADKIATLICSGETFKVVPMQGVDGDNVPVGTTYTWTVVDNPNVAGESDEILIPQPEISQTLANTTNSIEEVIYTVIPVTSNGCQGESFIISVTVNPEIQDNAIITNVLCSYSNPICAGSIEVNPTGIAPFTFYWSSNNGNLSRPENQNQFNLCPGDYSLEITDSSGCTQSFNYTITPPEPIEVNLISLVDMSCNNIGLNCDGYIELDIQGGTLPYIQKEFYTESNPGSGQFDVLVETNSNILNNACEGNYVFKVLDTNGCEFVSSIYTIKETSLPITITENISNYNGYEISCLGANDGFMDITVSGGSGSFAYNLSPGGILDSDLNSQNVLEFRNLKAGTYTLTITDDNCPNNITLNFNLEEPSELNSSSKLISQPALCSGDTVTYNISASGGTAPYTGTGNYTFTAGVHSIKITDANGCETIETITVTEPDQLTATAIVTNPILCNGKMGEVTVTASGGVPPYKGTGVFNVKSGDFIFTVTDANGCTYSNNIFVNEPAELSFTIDSTENPTCSPDWSYSNGSICITITGGTDPSPNGAGWISLGGGVWCLNGLSVGTYKIDIDDIHNCSTNTDSKEVVLTRPPIIDAQITATVTEDCDNNAMIQTNYIFVTGGSPPYEISWSGGNVCNPLNPQCMETTESGTYIAYIHDQESLTNGCPPIEVEVIVDLPIIGDAAFSYSSANSAFCNLLSNNELITFNNESTGDVVNFYWDFGDGSPIITGEMNPTHLFKMAGSYEVSLTVEYESKCCKETYSEVIEVTKGYDIKMPNAFTPNQDGINDTIRPLFSCMQNIQMFIYDIWGTLVYTEKGTTSLNGWDGNIKGKPAENGNYVMIVNGTTFYGKEISENTSITLIR